MSAATKQDRQRAIRELVARGSAGSQQELAAALRSRGFPVTQATVSRDITELGLVKVARGDRHVYLSPEDLAPPAVQSAGSDERLRRILADIPVRIGRSGLTLLLIGSPGSASVLGQAVDESSFDEQVGTLAGDNTLLVLFPDEAHLQRWLDRFRRLQDAPGRSSSFATHAITEAQR
jgi:transcriptional regulator of arginine metabolism